MRQLIIFGDSVIKGVHHCGGKFHLCPDHDFASLQAVGVEAHNYAKMGATIGTGLSILQRRLSACVPGATVLFSFGGNDCDYNWAEIAAAPEASICRIRRRSAFRSFTGRPSRWRGTAAQSLSSPPSYRSKRSATGA